MKTGEAGMNEGMSIDITIQGSHLYKDEQHCEINWPKEYLASCFIRCKQLTLTIVMLCVMDHACGLARVATVKLSCMSCKEQEFVETHYGT